MIYAILLVFISFSICKNSKVNWAVLVAGSKDFKNYRHQADTFHAYQLLKKNGVNPEHIIVFAHDDIANNKQNPFPGKVFNNPTGGDVYKEIKIDYRSDDVTPGNYINVLTGKKNAMKGIGSGKVLESTSEDNVFLYFTDHGSRKLVAFPNDYLYANELIDALKTMHSLKMYKELVFYMEACYSGSMFDQLPSNLNIYVTTAANPKESSYANYCYPDDKINGKHIGTCLGDEYSSKWMERIEEMFGKKMTLKSHFNFIQKETKGSHVMAYGDKTIQKRLVNEFMYGKSFQSEEDREEETLEEEIIEKEEETFKYIEDEEDSDDDDDDDIFGFLFNKKKRNNSKDSRVDSRDVYLYNLKTQAMISNDQNAYIEYKNEKKLVERSQIIFQEFRNELNLPDDHIDGETDFDCLKFSIETYKQLCGLEDRDIRHLNDFTNACTVNTTKTKIKQTLENICQKH